MFNEPLVTKLVRKHVFVVIIAKVFEKVKINVCAIISKKILK